MKGNKRLKDPIYGYITIPNEYINGIIDTAAFQRLRRIIQTSYSPLYSSAVHNRFVHSLGVYHLGRLAFRQIKKENNEKHFFDNDNLVKLGRVFELACLLHDVGHAPFSHTGEVFYLGESETYEGIHKDLKKSVNSSEFDVPLAGSKAAAPHEIMSALIGLKEFKEYLPEDNPENRSFFARCITGYQYKDSPPENKLKNCFISLLNSAVIDVDKLDYLIRDAFITGFDTVSIDYERLISSLTIVNDSNEYRIAYHKGALSVIENVVYAHDAERKWIQNHPVVVYDGYLLYHMIRHLNEEINTEKEKLFSMESLSANGHEFENGMKIRLMSDDDIIYLAKNVYSLDLGEEYFDRISRRHPAWKSEAEYKSYFLRVIGNGSVLDDFENVIEEIGEYLKKYSNNGVINDTLIEKIEKDIPSQDDCNLSDLLGDKIISIQNKNKLKMLKILCALREYAKSNGLKFDFVILTASQFNSGFGKPDFANIEIDFSTESKKSIMKFSDIASSLQAKNRKRDRFFYLFYKRDNGDPSDLDCDEIVNVLYKTCLDFR